MSLDRSALEHIQELSIAAEKITEGGKTFFETVVLPKSMAVYSLEQHQKYRNRFRAEFYTKTLADYLDYVKDNDGECVYVNPAAMRAVTIFDIGDNTNPGHCKHKAKLSLEETPEYKAVLGINEQRLSQRQLAEFVEDWIPNISVVDANGNDMESRVAINAIRRITIESISKGESQISNMSQSKSALESIEARSGDFALPAWITFDCAPYEGFADRLFAMRLSVSTAQGEPKLRATIQKLEKHKVEMANELSTKVKAYLPDVDAYLGTIDTE